MAQDATPTQPPETAPQTAPDLDGSRRSTLLPRVLLVVFVLLLALLAAGPTGAADALLGVPYGGCGGP